MCEAIAYGMFELFQLAYCCCQTMSGGYCCGYTPICSKFILGCFCA